MEGLLLTLAVMAVLVTVITVATFALALHSLRRRNRLSPKVATTAPLMWLWSPRLAARLHRHLGQTVGAGRACAAAHSGGLSLGDLVADLEAHACAIDGQLVIASRAPQPARTRLLRELQAEVGELDALAERVIRMNRAWSGAVPSTRGLAPVRDRVEALESALADLDRIGRLPESPGHRSSAG